MRALLIVPMFVLMAADPGALQKERPPAREPKKGEPIVVKGCLTGLALEATDLGSLGLSGELSSGLTFRLTGDKTLLKQLKAEHDEKLVEIEGILKSDLPRESVATRKVGKMRITIGTPAAAPLSPEAQAQRALPVLEVKAYDGISAVCRP